MSGLGSSAFKSSREIANTIRWSRDADTFWQGSSVVQATKEAASLEPPLAIIKMNKNILMNKSFLFRVTRL